MPSPRVLIVEDEILVAAELEATLQDRGFSTVGIAPDMDSALALAREEPDLALVDVNLRDGRTGPKVASRLSEEFGIAVLYLTANPAMVAEAPGAIGVLDKPFDEDVVAAALEFALNIRNGSVSPSPPKGLRLINKTGRSELPV